MSRCVIMRHPVLMEDEGRPEVAKICDSVEEAKAWIDSQKNEYFKPQDYFILRPHDGSLEVSYRRPDGN